MNTTVLDQKGFTIIELAIVLVIIGLLLGSFIGSLTQRIENSRINEANKELEEIKLAIKGYAYANQYLPCPDCNVGDTCAGGSAGDGEEDRANDTCIAANKTGAIPWATLGVAKSDPWGTRYRYWIDTLYARVPPTYTLFDLDTNPGDANISERSADGTSTELLATGVVAVIMSHGKNTYGGINEDDEDTPAVPAANVDEGENSDSDHLFISRPPSDVDATTAGGEFDDLLIWISEYEIKADMVKAGRLPR